MTEQGALAVEPWVLRETYLDLGRLAQSESVFALANGYVGWRGNLEEGEPHGLPGSYLNGVYEVRPLPYAEVAYGLPETGQSVINVTNGKLIRLFVDDEPFDVRYGELRAHERLLDFRAGVLNRQRRVGVAGREGGSGSPRPGWCRSPSGRSLPSAMRWSRSMVRPGSRCSPSWWPTSSCRRRPARTPARPPCSTAPLVGEYQNADGTAVVLTHSTRVSGLHVAAAMDHLIDGPPGVLVESRVFPDGGLVTAAAMLQPGQKLRVVKFVAYGSSGERSLTAVRDQAWAALTAARQCGWDGLLAEQRAYLDDFWDRADVEIDGDTEVQQAVRFALFHVLQAGARAETKPIPAKGLTGPGYDGHAFWDTETFVLPVLTLTAPDAAANALRWRHYTLPMAIERAAEHGRAGALFPWRTIAGQACSAYWPAGTAAFHINADIADAVIRYVDATGDEAFDRGPGMDLLTHTARLWLLPRATTTRRGGSASTGSPARTSTAPWWTTTSTPT